MLNSEVLDNKQEAGGLTPGTTQEESLAAASEQLEEAERSNDQERIASAEMQAETILSESINAKEAQLINQAGTIAGIESDGLPGKIADPEFIKDSLEIDTQANAVAAEAGALMAGNLKEHNIEALDQNIGQLRAEIKTAEAGRDEAKVLESEAKLRRLENIKALRVAYEKDLQTNDDKYSEYSKQLSAKQAEIDSTEAWDEDKKRNLISEKQRLEEEFQSFVKDELEPTKAGRLLSVVDKPVSKSQEFITEETDNSSGKPESQPGAATELNKAKESLANIQAEEEAAKHPDEARESKFNKIASTSIEVTYKTTASIIGVKFLSDIGLTAWAKLGDAAGKGESKLFKFAKSNDIYKVLKDKTDSKEVLSVLSEGEKSKLEVAKKVAAVREKIDANKRLTPAEKEQYLKKLESVLQKGSESSEANNKKSQAELKQLTKSYLESKSSVSTIVKDAANTALTFSGFMAARAVVYGGLAASERVMKAKQEYSKQYAGEAEKPGLAKHIVKDLCITSVKETLKGLVLSRTDAKGQELTKLQRATNLIKSAGAIARIVGIGGMGLHELADSAYVLDKSAGLQHVLEAAKAPNESVMQAMGDNFSNNVNHLSFGLMGSKLGTDHVSTLASHAAENVSSQSGVNTETPDFFKDTPWAAHHDKPFNMMDDVKQPETSIHINKSVEIQAGGSISKALGHNVGANEKITFIDHDGNQSVHEAGKMLVHPGDKVMEDADGNIYVTKDSGFKVSEISHNSHITEAGRESLHMEKIEMKELDPISASSDMLKQSNEHLQAETDKFFKDEMLKHAFDNSPLAEQKQHLLDVVSDPKHSLKAADKLFGAKFTDFTGKNPNDFGFYKTAGKEGDALVAIKVLNGKSLEYDITVYDKDGAPHIDRHAVGDLTPESIEKAKKMVQESNSYVDKAKAAYGLTGQKEEVISPVNAEANRTGTEPTNISHEETVTPVGKHSETIDESKKKIEAIRKAGAASGLSQEQINKEVAKEMLDASTPTKEQLADYIGKHSFPGLKGLPGHPNILPSNFLEQFKYDINNQESLAKAVSGWNRLLDKQKEFYLNRDKILID